MKNNNKDDKNKKSFLKGILIFTAILMSILFAIVFLSSNDKKYEDKTILSYTDLLKQISEKNVEKVEMTTGSSSAKITLKEKIKNEEEEETETKGEEVLLTILTNKIKSQEKDENGKVIDPDLIKRVIIPNNQNFISVVQDAVAGGNEIELIQKSPSFLSSIPSYIFSLLPTFIMLALFILIFKMQGLGDKGEVYNETERKTKVRFTDVAGLDEEKEEMVELVQFLKQPKKFIEMGAKIPKGVLLYGKPGTGKTLIAKAIAGEAGVPFISMSGSEFIEMFAGLGASRVRRLFDKARKMSPCIVFIDEIDAIGSRRTSGSGAESENNQTLNQLLVEMDGFGSEETIIVLAATNRPEMLDKALLRPRKI